MSWVDSLRAWIAPPRCPGCDEPGFGSWCPLCGTPQASSEPPAAVLGVPVLALGTYRGALARAIRRFKYQERPDLARTLAMQLVPLASRVADRPITWVPVPLHPKRLVERGFNQSALLARHLARFTNAESAPRALARTRNTEHQTRLERASRELNVDSAFCACRSPPKRVGLIDDVVTSGATARACIHALTGAGSRVVAVIALAYAESEPDLKFLSSPVLLPG